jgi:uncharacterized radical SAM superfamily Fe-S cluster-containing enzyme
MFENFVFIGTNAKVYFESGGGAILLGKLVLDHGDKETKKIRVEQLSNIEKTVYIRIAGNERVYAHGNNDTSTDPTTSVHTLTFEFKPNQLADFKDTDNKVILGIAHDMYPYELSIKTSFRENLIRMLN